MRDVADDAGMTERGEHLRLSLEALDVSAPRANQQLEGDVLPALGVASQVHLPHATGPGLALYCEAPVHDLT